MQEAQEARLLSCDKPAGDIPVASCDDDRKEIQNLSERVPKEVVDTPEVNQTSNTNDSKWIPKEGLDMSAKGTTKTVLNYSEVDRTAIMNNLGGTIDITQDTKEHSQTRAEGSSDGDSEQATDEDAAKFRQIPESGDIDLDPRRRFSSSRPAPMKPPGSDMTSVAWNHYRPWYPAPWFPPQAPPANHWHITIRNSNTNNQVTEEDVGQ